MAKQDKTVRIGGASGFWGDSMLGAPQLVNSGQIDYLVFDYLAELPMSILAAQRAKRPEAGWATDFVEVALRSVLNSKLVTDRFCALPFWATVLVFAMAGIGLAYSLFPYVVVDRLTVWQAAASRESLLVILFGIWTLPGPHQHWLMGH